MSPFSPFEMSLSRVTDLRRRAAEQPRPARPRCSAPRSRTERKAERDTLPTSDISNRQSQRHLYRGLTAAQAHVRANYISCDFEQYTCCGCKYGVPPTSTRGREHPLADFLT